MTVSVQQFKLHFPEFVATPDSLVTVKIAEATLRVNATVWGDRADAGVRYLTAHLISISPRGESAKKAGKGFESTYLHEYKRLMYEVTGGYRVT